MPVPQHDPHEHPSAPPGLAGRRPVGDDGSEDWDARVRDVWAAAAAHPGTDVLPAVERLAAGRSPDDPAALVERASAHDHAGRETEAAPLYRQALAAGLDGDRRAQAVVQLASTLRVLGRPHDAVDLLERERQEAADDDLGDARTAFPALALADAGHERRALAEAFTALAAHPPWCGRPVRHDASELPPAEEG